MQIKQLEALSHPFHWQKLNYISKNMKARECKLGQALGRAIWWQPARLMPFNPAILFLDISWSLKRGVHSSDTRYSQRCQKKALVFTFTLTFGCAGSRLLCTGFSLQWPLLLQSTGSSSASGVSVVSALGPWSMDSVVVALRLQLPVISGLPGWLSGKGGDAGFRALGWEDPPKKEMATHSSILAWEIPWTVHGVTRVRHDLATKQQKCGIYLDQGSKLCPLHWQAESYPLYHQGNPKYIFLFKRKTSQLNNLQ